MKILVLNGPNINMLGIREPGIYGSNSFADLLSLLAETAKAEHITIDQYQSNHEGDLVDIIQFAYGLYDGIVINPGAYTHTSIAILDAVKSVNIPTVEVHISKVEEREDSITIYPGEFESVEIETFEDHRVAMSFTMSGMGEKSLKILDPMCCRKTFENYFEIIDGLCW